MIDKDKDQEKGDEVLRRLLKTPPEPKSGKEENAKPKGRYADSKRSARTFGSSQGEVKS